MSYIYFEYCEDLNLKCLFCKEKLEKYIFLSGDAIICISQCFYFYVHKNKWIFANKNFVINNYLDLYLDLHSPDWFFLKEKVEKVSFIDFVSETYYRLSYFDNNANSIMRFEMPENGLNSIEDSILFCFDKIKHLEENIEFI